MQKPKYVSGKRWLPGKQIEIKSAGQVKCSPNSFQAPSSLHHLHILHLISHLSHLFRSNILLPCALHLWRDTSASASQQDQICIGSVFHDHHQLLMSSMSGLSALWKLQMCVFECFGCFPRQHFVPWRFKLHRPRALIGRKDAHWRVVKTFGNHLAFKMMWVVDAVQLLC